MEGPSKRPSSSLVRALGIILLVAALFAAVMPTFHKARPSGSSLTPCTSNIKNLATALRMYASDNQGQYPATLDKLPQGNYLKTVPTCPAAGRVTYTDYCRNAQGDSFSFSCVGLNHSKLYQGRLGDLHNYPRFDSQKGLLEPPRKWSFF